MEQKKVRKKTIELIVPCYNEEKCIALFFKRIEEVFASGGLENYLAMVTFVDDGSKDDTLREIKSIQSHQENVKMQYISLSRNFGKESAMYAGLSKSTGDYVAVMDVDLQHPPELLYEMVTAIEKEGYDCATARRISRKGESVVRSFLSKAYYWIIDKLTGIEMVQGSTDYRLMTRNVVEAVVAMRERERFTKGIYSWVGFKNKWIEYVNVERIAGTTNWNLLGLFGYACSSFFSFATTPLRAVIYLGILTVIIAVGGMIYIFRSALRTPGTERTGYATIVILIMFFSGVIITILGVIGEYLARIYMEVKNRPIYLIRETNIKDERVDAILEDGGEK